MINICKSCGKEEFQNLTESVYYIKFCQRVLEFCSDDCSKNFTLIHSYKMKERREHYMMLLYILFK
jgi:hypothetical protein